MTEVKAALAFRAARLARTVLGAVVKRSTIDGEAYLVHAGIDVEGLRD